MTNLPTEDTVRPLSLTEALWAQPLQVIADAGELSPDMVSNSELSSSRCNVARIQAEPESPVALEYDDVANS